MTSSGVPPYRIIETRNPALAGINDLAPPFLAPGLTAARPKRARRAGARCAVPQGHASPPASRKRYRKMARRVMLDARRRTAIEELPRKLAPVYVTLTDDERVDQWHAVVANLREGLADDDLDPATIAECICYLSAQLAKHTLASERAHPPQ